MDKIILHCDINSFYASVEVKKHPELRGLPVAVAGDPEKRHGIILAKTPEAKRSGVETGEAIWLAKKKCPSLILVRPDYSSYVHYSEEIKCIYTEYTDMVESFGMDECWLDVTGSTKLFGDGRHIADSIREKVKERTGLSISAGVSFSKVFAKLGSDMKKPDATTVIDRSNYKTLAWPLPVSELIMVGNATAKVLETMGVLTIGDLAKADRALLERRLGKVGLKLQDSARGDDIEPVRKYYEHTTPESVGNGSTAPADMNTRREAMALILALSDMVGMRLRSYGLYATGVSLYLRDSTLEGRGMQTRLPLPADNSAAIQKCAATLLDKMWKEGGGLPLRMITVTAINLISADQGMQITLFDTQRDRESSLERSVDRIRGKYGKDIVKRAALLQDSEVSSKIIDDPDFKPFKK